MMTDNDATHAWPADARRDRVIGDWHLYQRSGGHRTSTDDVLTAWFAVARNAGKQVDRYLDLGTGIGSVLLMVAHRLRPRQTCGIEAQAQSVTMARRSVAELPGHDRAAIEIVEADFRHEQLNGESFDLITGSPPYFPLETGVHPKDPQRLACRFEVRGGVEHYCRAAAQRLAEGARLYLVFQTRGDARVQRAAQQAHLHVTARADVQMHADRRDPFLTVYELQRSPGALESVSFAIRDARGEITSAYAAARRELGVDP